MCEEIILYCDESQSKGRYYSNFYGGALIKSFEIETVQNKLNDLKIELNFHNEVKWQRITENYLEKYITLIDTFFNIIKDKKIKMRIMFTHNRNIPQELTDYHRENEYFMLYYQFIKHAFGLKYFDSVQKNTKMRIYCDQFPDKNEKVQQFRSFLANMSDISEYKNRGITITEENIVGVNSCDHVILQCVDIVLGAMQFRLNDFHKAIPEGKKRRGKRTVAKEKVYNYINKRIRDIYPNFNIGITTSLNTNPLNLWLHQYRHWLFEPKNKTVTSLNKRKK